ncbi:MAG: hypothetical protein KDC10_16430, partial [Calditrichaeota bacterium]|nr:hypothetical protein [Calditrichota bacterium]
RQHGSSVHTVAYDLSVTVGKDDFEENDTCATAIAIGPGRTPFYTTAATHTATLSCGLTDSSPDAWFSWTALCDATVTLSTCGDANYDTVLGMWDACGGTLISCIDDNCSNLKSYIAFSATGGSTYYFEVSGYLGAFGHGGLTLTVAPPANDTCASATPISGAGTHDYCTQYATHTADNCVSTAGDVWYMYTADCASLVTFTTCDANPSYDTAIALWDACDGTMLDCNDDWFDGMNYPCNVDSRIDRYMLQGEQVLVQMGGFLSSNGQSTLTVSTICYDPPNDLCALALPLGEGVTAFTNVGAETDGPDEATLCNNANDTNVGADVWYTYSSVTSGVVTIDLSGSLYDTKIAVYQGLCPSMESAIACDDDGGSGLTSLVTFGACADQQYLIRIGGFTPSTGIPRTGTGTMDVSLAPVDTPMNPQNLQIEILDDSVLLNWAPVLENVLGCPMAASSYDVYSTDADGNEALVASTPLTSVVLPYENVDDTVRSYRVVALSAASWRTAPVAFTGNT